MYTTSAPRAARYGAARSESSASFKTTFSDTPLHSKFNRARIKGESSVAQSFVENCIFSRRAREREQLMRPRLLLPHYLLLTLIAPPHLSYVLISYHHLVRCSVEKPHQRRKRVVRREYRLREDGVGSERVRECPKVRRHRTPALRGVASLAEAAQSPGDEHEAQCIP